jgi:ATP-dependent DNA helicase RecG (EC 3.6.1.-)
MDKLTNIINSIKGPLLFISRTKKIETVKDLEITIGNLIERAIVFNLNDVQQNLIVECKKCFCDFALLDGASKLKRIEEALRLISSIEIDITTPSREEDVSPAIEKKVNILLTPIQYIKGVGPRLAELLKKKGIATIEDALYFIPRDYEDRRNIKPIFKAQVGEKETLKGKIVGLSLVSYNRRKVLEVIVRDETGVIIAKWFNFNQPYLNYLKKKFKPGQVVIVSGKVEAFRYRKEMSHPDIEVIENEDDDQLHFKRIVPKYSETEGLHQKTIRSIMKNVVEGYAGEVSDGIPRYISKKRNLADMSRAFQRIHFPENDDNFDLLITGKSPYHQRIVFDEFFFLELSLALRKRGVLLEKGISFTTQDNFLEIFEQRLPFRLTTAQRRVINEIKTDMKKPSPMNRLIQGDVGSGKTIVAFAAALIAIENHYQVAIMAPTEILAEQHFLTLHQLAEQIGIKIAYLFSSMKKSSRDEVYKNIKNGKINLIIGTNAIIQEGVEFAKLGLGIIDEQHRFGVIQRATLKRKGESPDILVMTATPIPRTLAMTVYGDLDISIIDEMPPGRKPVKTKVFHEKERQRVYDLISREVEGGNQAYIVYPLIEESEKLELLNATKMYEHIQKEVFPQYRAALLHGRMKSEEKEEVMQRFKANEVQILVATTVIEVGIDVPQATLMVVEHAERFGLSQLHQLRGRVGRGEKPSYCVLLAQYKKSDDARRRLKIMEETNDGFKIAEEDLSIRGPGEFIGVRQSGIPDFRVANIIRDARILNEAREEAFELVRRDPFLQDTQNFFLKEVLKQRWKGRLELAGVG